MRVEEAEGLPLLEGLEPERNLRENDGERIEVDPVETLTHHGPLSLMDQFWRNPDSGSDSPSPRMGEAEDAGRLHEERPRAHCGVAYLQCKQLSLGSIRVGGSQFDDPLDDRVESGMGEVLGNLVWRVERAASLAPT